MHAVISHCQKEQCFAILSTPLELYTADNLPRVPGDTSARAIYFPWIAVSRLRLEHGSLDSATGQFAGAYARCDRERGVMRVRRRRY